MMDEEFLSLFYFCSKVHRRRKIQRPILSESHTSHQQQQQQQQHKQTNKQTNKQTTTKRTYIIKERYDENENQQKYTCIFFSSRCEYHRSFLFLELL
jgi:hypothetical protein